MAATGGAGRGEMVREHVSDLAAALERCAERCEDALGSYVGRNPDARSSRFGVNALLAAAAMTTAAQRLIEGGDAARLALHIASTLARDAAASARSAGLDDDALLIATECERIAARCDQVLAAGRA